MLEECFVNKVSKSKEKMKVFFDHSIALKDDVYVVVRILFLIQNFLNQFDFCFSLPQNMVMNLRQRKLKIELV